MEGGAVVGRRLHGRSLCARALRGMQAHGDRPAARRDLRSTAAAGSRRTCAALPSPSARCDTDDEAARFAAAARAAGVPVNVIDKPAFCDFSFGAIVNRSPLVIAISTDGAAPVFAQAVRAKLEALIPRGFARWAEAAKLWRRKVQISGLSFDGRRQFWRAFAALAMRHPDDVPQHADYDRLFAETAAGAAVAEQGSVTLVDAGPGDPELLTLARGAGAAIGRRHPLRRPGVARGPGVRPTRGEEDAGRRRPGQPRGRSGAGRPTGGAAGQS